MAPLTIAIRKDPDGIDPISPLPVRVNDYSNSRIPSPTVNRNPGSRILSNKPATRQEPKSNGENTKSANVQQKIEGIMYEMEEAKKLYDELQEKQGEGQIANAEDLEQQVMLQEMEIMNLTAEIEQMRHKRGANSIGDQIKQQEASNAAKYAEIQKMEEKLQSMQREQDDFKSAQQSTFVMKPTSDTYAEINKLQDDIANLQVQQERIRAKSQPWNQDLKKQEGVCEKKTELEVVANKDIVDCEEPVDSESDSEEQNVLSLPSLEEKSKFIVNENQPVEIKKTKTLDSNSDTSATGDSSGDSSDSSSKASTVSAKENAVEIMHTDDGSIEAISYTRPALKKSQSQASDDGSFSSESNSSSESESAGSRGSSRDSSSGFYSSDASTESSSRSVLEQIPEETETDDSDAESQDEEAKELQAGSLILRKQLQESESKFEKLMSDYKQLKSESQVTMDELQQANRKLRDSQGSALKTMAEDSEKEEKARWLKQENKMLLKSMEKQNEVLEKANKNYEKLQIEHSNTLVMLQEKNKSYDALIADFSNLAGTGKNIDDYNRLRALHETVVLKLADMSEDNERLENERDAAVKHLEKNEIKLQAYDEAIASLNKTEYDLKMLETVHEETIIELQALTDKNKELKALNENGVSAEENEKLQNDYIKAKTELEMLSSANKEFSGIQEKLNASEVKVTMLEEEDKKMKEKLLVTKQKSKDRADQLKDVIAQYKKLKTEYSEKCDEVDRLKVTAKRFDGGKRLKEMEKLVESVQKAKEDLAEAKKGKRAREKDLRIVLQHYEKLQLKYQKIQAKLDSQSFDESSCASRSQPFDEASVTEGGQKQTSVASDDESSKHQEEVENLEKLLKESKESVVWKDDKIAQTLTELKSAKEQIETLEKEKKDLENELSEVKSQLLLARKETENAEEKQDNGQDRLRTAIAKHHQLQQVYDSLLKKFDDSRLELQKAKNDFKVKEQEEKHARKRATTVHNQYEKLKEDHDVVVQTLEKLKKQMEFTKPAEC